MPSNIYSDKGTKGQSMIACPFSSHNAQTFESNLIISKSIDSWSCVLACTLVDPTLDSLDVSMVAVFHLMHSLVPLHIQMVLGNFPQSPQTHQH